MDGDLTSPVRTHFLTLFFFFVGYYHEKFLRYRTFLSRNIHPKPKSLSTMQSKLRALSTSTAAPLPMASFTTFSSPHHTNHDLTSLLLNHPTLQQQQAQALAAAQHSCHKMPVMVTAKSEPQHHNSLLSLATLE